MSYRIFRRRRDADVISNRRLPVSISKSRFGRALAPGIGEGLRVFEDRRTWHPEGSWRTAISFSGNRHRLQDVARRSRERMGKMSKAGKMLAVVPGQMEPGVIAFQNPARVVVCARRQRRKEVLHALGKTGITGQRKPRFNWLSDISCKG